MKRIELIKSQVNQNKLDNVDKNTVTITDNRTGKLINNVRRQDLQL